MRDAGGLVAILAALALAGGVGARWLLRRCRRAIVGGRIQLAQRVADSERRFAFIHDGVLQDVQGLALSLQAIADRLAPDDPVRRDLESVLDRMDELLAEGRRRLPVEPGSADGGG